MTGTQEESSAHPITTLGLQSSPCIGWLVARTARDLEGPTVSRYPKWSLVARVKYGSLIVAISLAVKFLDQKKDGGLHDISKHVS